MSGLVILLGAEMNAEIEHASDYGKAEGERVPGEKRKIGPALKRAWEARRRRPPWPVAPIEVRRRTRP
jgi:membrane protein